MYFFHISVILCFVITIKYTNALNIKKFPDNFIIGVGSAAYQVEGAWNEDGKGENIWDRLVHSPDSHVYKKQSGDIASDHYHKYKEDVSLMKNLGVSHYRFSISWSRILPTGFNNKINPAGIAHYRNVIKELKDNGIQPFVTIYHWDTPQHLENIGGWTNELIVDKFVDFAKVLFDHFGEDVKYWQTINEPLEMCHQGYGLGTKAPAIKSGGIGEYLCGHNMIKAHAKVWHLYHEQYREKQQGIIGITVDSGWMEPGSASEEDKAAADRRLQFMLGWFTHPFIIGDYPPVMKKQIGDRSESQGFKQSRLPVFTTEEIEFTKGATDFLGVNTFTSFMVKPVIDLNRTEISWEADTETFRYQLDSWEQSTGTEWLKVTPWGIRRLLNWIKSRYGDIPLLIAENGYSDDGSTLEDDNRINYYQEHLSNVRDAIDDGVNVIGYIAWTFTDNFEWETGYVEKFGLYHVDFTSSNRTRTPKKSAEYFKQFARTKCIVEQSKCIHVATKETIHK